MTISLCDRVENTVGKEENAGDQHFLLFPQCFPKPSSSGSLKVRIFPFFHNVFKSSLYLEGQSLITCRRSLLKTLWKLLVTSILSFYQNVFYTPTEKFQFVSHFEFVFCLTNKVYNKERNE